MSLEELIDDFVHSPELQNHNLQLRYYAGLPVIEAIDDAVFGRYRDKDGLQRFSDHYWSVYQIRPDETKHDWIHKLYKARERILGLRLDQIDWRSHNFLDLYKMVRNVLEEPKIRWLGDLFYYDVSLRIGVALKSPVYPDHVFIQSGSKVGAEQLIDNELTEATIESSQPCLEINQFYDLSERFRRLEPHEIESFLCVKHEDLKRLN